MPLKNAMQPSWTPLFSSIILSSIWEEPKHVKILWITMIALKDKSGFVSASILGLKRAAVLSIEEVEDALKILEAPDPRSKSADFEGRRIERVAGGWRVLNHEQYQKLMREVCSKASAADRQKKHRLKKKGELPGYHTAEKMRKAGASEAEIDAFQASLLRKDQDFPG